ncbi:NUDIX domain-containing protein [Kitasatospora sp. NPDC090308]|uniref:NUDIX domain-containing protein n=1 Tax=Kitasatospora sp. NPDC090308 TaxID=3364082 RepID=UPI003822E470
MTQQGFPEVPEDRHPRRRAGCLGLVRDGHGRVLFVRTGYGKGLILPGGAAHPGEWFDAAARREWWEETGLHLEPGVLLAVDQVPADPASGAAEGVNFVFDAGVLTPERAAALRVPTAAADEVAGYEWVHPDDFDTHPGLAPYTARRVRQALAARHAGRGLPLLHHGEPVTDGGAGTGPAGNGGSGYASP